MKLRLTVLLFIFLLTPIAFADTSNAGDTQLLISIQNSSLETLSFSHVSGQNLNNQFRVMPTTLRPGEAGVVMGTTTSQSDLAGTLHFDDSMGNDNILVIIDRRQFHEGQSLFSMDSPKLKSTLVSKSHNPHALPLALMYTAVTIEIFEKN